MFPPLFCVYTCACVSFHAMNCVECNCAGAQYTCSRCKDIENAAYCGKECQVKHWKKGHALICANVAGLAGFAIHTQAQKRKVAAMQLPEATQEVSAFSSARLKEAPVRLRKASTPGGGAGGEGNASKFADKASVKLSAVDASGRMLLQKKSIALNTLVETKENGTLVAYAFKQSEDADDVGAASASKFPVRLQGAFSALSATKPVKRISFTFVANIEAVHKKGLLRRKEGCGEDKTGHWYAINRTGWEGNIVLYARVLQCRIVDFAVWIKAKAPLNSLEGVKVVDL